MNTGTVLTVTGTSAVCGMGCVIVKCSSCMCYIMYTVLMFLNSAWLPYSLYSALLLTIAQCWPGSNVVFNIGNRVLSALGVL
jgi:hypothetical protein